MDRLTAPKLNLIDNESFMPFPSMNAETNTGRKIPIRVIYCGLSLMWIATNFLTFAIGYHIKENHCIDSPSDGSL